MKLLRVLCLSVVCLGLIASSPLSAQEPKLRDTLKGHAQVVNSVAFSPDGKTLASGSDDKTIKLWDVATGKELVLPKPLLHPGAVLTVAFSPDGKMLASGSWKRGAEEDGNIHLWDVEKRTEKKATFDKQWPMVVSRSPVAFSPDNKTLASVSQAKIKLSDVQTGKQQTTQVDKPQDALRALVCVAFSPDGKTLAAGGVLGTLKLWDVQTGKPTANLQGHEGNVVFVAFSPDGKTLVSFDESAKTIKMWDVEKRKETRTLKGAGTGQCVAFSPNSEVLASGGLVAKTITLWDVATGNEKAIPTEIGVKCLAFSPDGKTLASGGRDKTIKLWDMP